MEQASSAFSTGVPALAAIPQLAGNSRQGLGPVASTMHWASSWVISSNTLGLSTSLYDGDAGSRSTGKERDAESGNDYFEARYYSSAMGRFMSPDWSEKPEAVPYANLENPQTLNLYSYMGNNPLSGADPDGHCDWCQKLGNWLSGSGWYTNAQVVDQHRSWLLEHVSTDADAKKVNSATPQQVNDTYACLHSTGCTQQMQDYVAAMKSAAQAAAAAVQFGNNPNQDYHTFRHVEDAGIDKQAAEKAIREDLAGKEDSLPQGLTKGRVNVGGKTLEYNAYKLSDGTINVGRITVH